MEIILNFMNEYGYTLIYTILLGIFSYLGITIKIIIKEYSETQFKEKVIKKVCEAIEQVYGDLGCEEKLNKATETAKEIIEARG